LFSRRRRSLSGKPEWRAEAYLGGDRPRLAVDRGHCGEARSLRRTSPVQRLEHMTGKRPHRRRDQRRPQLGDHQQNVGKQVSYQPDRASRCWSRNFTATAHSPLKRLKHANAMPARSCISIRKVFTLCPGALRRRRPRFDLYLAGTGSAVTDRHYGYRRLLERVHSRRGEHPQAW
jgi:hypothetical protein